MKFSYTALSGNNKKLSGLLEGVSLESAKEELHKIGLAIVSIQEISEEQYQKEMAEKKTSQAESGIKTFLFRATDLKGKEVEGTIDAVDDYNAYRRLIREYRFSLQELYPVGASDAEKIKAQENIKEWAEQYSQEEKEVVPTSEMEDLQEADEKIDKKIAEQIDLVITGTKKALKENANLFSAAHQAEIESKLNELERVRQSNNLKHIADLCHDIYELASTPDQIGEAAQGSQGNFKETLNQMSQSALIDKESALYQKSLGFTKIQNLGQSILTSMERFTKSSGGKTTFLSKIFKQIEPWFKKNNIGAQKQFRVQRQQSSNKLKEIWTKFSSSLLAPNKIVRQARFQEAWQAYRDYQISRKQLKQAEAIAKKERKMAETKTAKEKKAAAPKKNYAFLFKEIDSFIGWLLGFYITYLFLASFSLEKNIGLPKDFVFKTLERSLILNIAFLLFLSHFLLFLKTKYLNGRQVASFFLFALGYGLYALMIFNF